MSTTTITFKSRTYKPWKAYANLMLWSTCELIPVWGYENRIIATNADGEVVFVGHDFERITSKIDNGESGYLPTPAEVAAKIAQEVK